MCVASGFINAKTPLHRAILRSLSQMKWGRVFADLVLLFAVSRDPLSSHVFFIVIHKSSKLSNAFVHAHFFSVAGDELKPGCPVGDINRGFACVDCCFGDSNEGLAFFKREDCDLERLVIEPSLVVTEPEAVCIDVVVDGASLDQTVLLVPCRSTATGAVAVCPWVQDTALLIVCAAVLLWFTERCCS